MTCFLLYIFSLTFLTFPQKFCYYMHIRPPDDAVLVELFPVVLYEEKEVRVKADLHDTTFA